MPHPREHLSAAAIAAMPSTATAHPLNPNSVRLKKSLGDAVGLTQMGVHLITVPPGRDTTEYHRHWFEEEFLYVLSGTGQAEIDGQLVEVGTGDFMGFARGGAAHSLSNTGIEPLVCLVAGQRLEQDVCDYPKLNKRLYVNGAHEDLVDIQHLSPAPGAVPLP